MPTFLTDPPQALYLVLGGLLVVTALVAAQRQDRRTAIPFAAAFFLMLAAFLIDKLNESPREEAVRRAMLMAAAADAMRPDAFAEQLAEQVTIRTGPSQSKTLTREELKKHPFWDTLRTFDVHVAVWGFDRENARQVDPNTVEIGFMGKGEAQGKPFPVYVRATYSKQPDGSYKLSSMGTFDPMKHDEYVAIPNFP